MIKFIYKPFGIVASILGGLLASAVFKKIWKVSAGETDAPDATDQDSSWQEVLVSAAIQGAIFATVKALVNRAGAKGFERATGTWPGNTEPRHKTD